MSSSSTTSAPSSSSVAGQQMWSLKASHDVDELPTDFASAISADNWGAQEIEIPHSYVEYESSLGSPPETPDLLWDSRPSSGVDFSETQYKSVFEDWDDEAPNTKKLPVEIEEDGSQVLLIPTDSEFFNPHPTPKPFGFTQLPDLRNKPTIVIPPRRDSISAEALSTAVAPPTPVQVGRPLPTEKLELSDSGLRKGLMLFVDTTLLHSSLLNGVPVPSPFYSPGPFKPTDDVSSWVSKIPDHGPDVPLDCIYSAGDISPAERWDEPWSPISLVSPLHSTPCISHSHSF